MKKSTTLTLLFLALFIIAFGRDRSISAANNANTLVYMPVIQTQFELGVQPFASGIPAPSEVTAIVDPGDGRLFMAVKEGRILIIDANGVIENQLLLDIRDRVFASGFEVGLLGLAVHPDFENNGFIYVYFTRMIDGKLYSDLARFEVSPSGTADPQSEQNLLRQEEPYHIHQAGTIQFGPNDGYLYLATGDGGTPFDQAGFSQSLKSLHGKILRIDVNQGSPYAIPADNPFVDESKARGEIWAYGLRNPWRFSFDSKTGDMFIGDVGDSHWEEVNMIPAGSGGGQNFGWPCYEGNNFFVPDACHTNQQYTMPIFTYAHEQDIHHCSITGGYVYHGSQLPELEGKYIFADLCAGSIWTLSQNGSASWESKRWTPFTQNWSTIGERSDGELFLGTIDTNQIFKLTRAGNN